METFRQKPGVVALCITRLQNEFERRLYESLRWKLDQAGYRLLVFYSTTDFFKGTKNDTGEASIYSLVPFDRLDALIIVPETIKNEQIQMMLVDGAKKANIPIIAMNRELPGCDSILFDYTSSVEEIVRHVIRDHGCRRVNFLAGNKGNSFSEERLAMYKKVLTEEHIAIEEKRIGYGDFWSLPARAAAEKFLEEEELPEAIVCANDSMAIAVCQLLKERKIRVPEDIIVTGLDSIEFERFHMPRLTTASIDTDKAAKKVVEILNEYQSGSHTTKTYEIPNQVRFSQSCGCRAEEELDSNQLTQHLYDEIYRLSAFEESMSNMVSEVAASYDFEQAVTNFDRYVDEFSLRDVSICMVDNFTSENLREENVGTFQKKLIPIVNKRDGNYVNLGEFETKQLAPDLEKLIQKEDAIFFLPLHFQEAVLALFMIGIPKGFHDFRLLNSFHISLNHTLGILQSQEVLRLALEKMKNMTSHDFLTGILNRSGFFADAKKLIREGIEKKQQLCIFSVDLNGLKMINDTYGHHEGDFALKKVAEAMDACAGEGTVCARFGGDEFSICGLADDPKSECEAYEAKVTKLLNDFNQTGQKPYEISASFGWSSEAPREDMNLDALICKADEKMYAHKIRRR